MTESVPVTVAATVAATATVAASATVTVAAAVAVAATVAAPTNHDCFAFASERASSLVRSPRNVKLELGCAGPLF